ncbi:MAG: universal stress protein [Gaiellaceae bacterium]
MAGSIICGIDDSESAKEAARVARALAAELRLGLVFVRVVGQDAPDAQVSAIAERLERLSAGSTDVDCGAAWLVEAGQPADCLVSAAAKGEAALIVIGSTESRSSMFSGISADVSRRAPCPVVVVPPAAHACAANGRRVAGGPAGEDRDFAGGIARLGLGERGTDFAGGIARLGLGRGGTDFAGGIARFNLGSREPGD